MKIRKITPHFNIFKVINSLAQIFFLSRSNFFFLAKAFFAGIFSVEHTLNFELLELSTGCLERALPNLLLRFLSLLAPFFFLSSTSNLIVSKMSHAHSMIFVVSAINKESDIVQTYSSEIY